MILVEKSRVALRAREVVDRLMSPILVLFQQMHFSETFMTNIAGESSVSVNEGFVLPQISQHVRRVRTETARERFLAVFVNISHMRFQLTCEFPGITAQVTLKRFLRRVMDDIMMLQFCRLVTTETTLVTIERLSQRSRHG